jgi:two-component system LytT family response regulator
MMPLRVLVADDERPARQKLRRLLSSEPDVTAILEASDGPMALKLIREAQPDVALLDIQLPGMTGVDLARALQEESSPYVIFVTAYDQFAIDAFDVSAIDYVLKPYDRERLVKALGRARDAVRRNERAGDLERALRLLATTPAAPVDRLAVELNGRTVFVRTADIDRIEADRNHLVLHVPPQRHRLRGTVSGLEARLDPRRFVRVGRGTIVNLDAIVELRPLGHGDSEALLRSGARVRVGRRFRERLDSPRAGRRG